MFTRLNHHLQKFSYTRIGDIEFQLTPIFLRMNEQVAFKYLERHLKTLNGPEIKYDEIHHEIFVKEENCEITYLFTQDENAHAIISVSTYAHKHGISYKRILKALEDLKELFSSYLIDEK